MLIVYDGILVFEGGGEIFRFVLGGWAEMGSFGLLPLLRQREPFLGGRRAGGGGDSGVRRERRKEEERRTQQATAQLIPERATMAIAPST